MAGVGWSLIGGGETPAIRCGDWVSAEAGGLPIYEVMEIDRERLWLRDTMSRRDYVLPAQSLRWRLALPGAQTG
jgi:hypothetical protein